ncbi:MAG: InlB B-repeat-containing protein, partial [Bacilli bacterium]|nr:InlB B-repeat-containing protein [Bacilli bacterium]
MKKYLTCLLVLIMLLFTGCIKNYKTVTFDSDGGTPVESIKVEKGNTINEPSAPTKEKYEFVGWFLDGEKFNFKNTKIEKNITLKAGWLKNEVTYEVVFKDYDGTELKKETVKEGNSATAPVPPTREGYTFTGWDKDFTNVQSNLVVTAQYEKNEVTYEVVFKDYDGTELKKETVKEGNS